METFRVERYGHSRFWAVCEDAGTLVGVCVYKRGAMAIAARLNALHTAALRTQALDDAQRWVDANGPAHEVAAPAVGVDPARARKIGATAPHFPCPYKPALLLHSFPTWPGGGESSAPR